MIELNFRDENGDNIVARIIAGTHQVECLLYREMPGNLFTLWKPKLVEIRSDYEFLDTVKRWNHRDYVNWAENQLDVVNKGIRRDKDRQRTADKINNGLK